MPGHFSHRFKGSSKGLNEQKIAKTALAVFFFIPRPKNLFILKHRKFADKVLKKHYIGLCKVSEIKREKTYERQACKHQ